MAKNCLVTSLTCTHADAFTGKQKPYWVEVQLVDEEGSAVGGIPWQAESRHPNEGRIEAFTHSGISDDEGLIRIDMPHGLELRLTLTADPLTTEMEKRHLRPGRDAVTDSIVRPHAEEKGYLWHYAVVGELCRMLPSLELREGEVWPPFHFPHGKTLKGVIIRTNQLQKRHVIEICPFRAWELVLHHQEDYSIANAINLGAAASLAYADDYALDVASIARFFIHQCQDLSRLPQLHKGKHSYNTLVQDVPFSERYFPPVFMDTSRDTSNTATDNKPGETVHVENESDIVKSDGDTQLFYVYNADKIIISWRGTASLYDVVTDLTFRPINTEVCDIEKTECTTLLPAGKVHGGFWRGYGRFERKFEVQLKELRGLVENYNLFVCGHSLGGALALINSAKLKYYNPILYTYGMPRTFTRDAIEQLSTITHYRHVNDNDPVPAVPPEANMDNELYRLWGPIGTVLGGLWSTIQLAQWQLVKWGDCFWHHGKPVAFITATQSRQWQECKIALPYPKNCMTLRRRLPIKAKLYLVPALAEQQAQAAGEQQKAFKKSLTKEDLAEFFPAGKNFDRGADLTFNDHFMTSYMPYINNKLLELIDREGIIEQRTFVEHRYNIDRFKQQIAENKSEVPENEKERNEIFLSIEDALKISLTPTFAIPCGRNALLRFALYGKEVIENAY